MYAVHSLTLLSLLANHDYRDSVGTLHWESLGPLVDENPSAEDRFKVW